MQTNKKYATQILNKGRETWIEADTDFFFDKIDGETCRLIKSDSRTWVKVGCLVRSGTRKAYEKASALVHNMDTACREILPVRVINHIYSKAEQGKCKNMEHPLCECRYCRK